MDQQLSENRNVTLCLCQYLSQDSETGVVPVKTLKSFLPFQECDLGGGQNTLCADLMKQCPYLKAFYLLQDSPLQNLSDQCHKRASILSQMVPMGRKGKAGAGEALTAGLLAGYFL
jgi:hypothetical protein